MKKSIILGLAALTLMACQKERINPFLTQQDTPYGVPAFDQYQLADYEPAFEEAIKQYQAEVDAIIANPDAPTFDNTIAALDRCGSLLDLVQGVFFNVLEAAGVSFNRGHSKQEREDKNTKKSLSENNN